MQMRVLGNDMLVAKLVIRHPRSYQLGNNPEGDLSDPVMAWQHLMRRHVLFSFYSSLFSASLSSFPIPPALLILVQLWLDLMMEKCICSEDTPDLSP